MKKRILALILIIVVCVPLVPFSAFAATTPAYNAGRLHTLGLFQGVGTNADGSPNFALYRAPTRAEAVAMLVRLLGAQSEALSGTWATPFNDVPAWAAPYVGYAYVNGLTQGTGPTTFGSQSYVTAAQYITFVLRALGFESGQDFEWYRSWELSDSLGFTNGRFNAATAVFLRGDVAEISFDALSTTFANSDITLYYALIDAGVFTEAAARYVGLGTQAPTQHQQEELQQQPQQQQQQEEQQRQPPANPRYYPFSYTQSSITLPNRRLTDAERQEWIDEYFSMGGPSAFELEIVRLTNEIRAAYGLGPLVLHDTLMKVARFYTQTMANLNTTLGHSEGPYDGPHNRQRLGGGNWGGGALEAFGFTGSTGGNGMAGHWTPQAAVDGWMNSPGHRDNILNPSYTHIGVGSHLGGQWGVFHYQIFYIS